MALDDLPPLGSRELEALLMEGLKPLDEVPYPLMDQPSAEWLLDPSPAGEPVPRRHPLLPPRAAATTAGGLALACGPRQPVVEST